MNDTTVITVDGVLAAVLHHRRKRTDRIVWQQNIRHMRPYVDDADVGKSTYSRLAINGITQLIYGLTHTHTPNVVHGSTRTPRPRPGGAVRLENSPSWFLPARRYASAGIWYRAFLCVCVCVIRVLCIKMAKRFVEILLPPDSPIILGFRHRGSLLNSDGFIPNGAPNSGWENWAIFDQ